MGQALGFGLWALGKKSHATIRHEARGAGHEAGFKTNVHAPGWGGEGVFTTFITGEFSRGPWTIAVQGEKYLKYF